MKLFKTVKDFFSYPGNFYEEEEAEEEAEDENPIEEETE